MSIQPIKQTKFDQQQEQAITEDGVTVESLIRMYQDGYDLAKEQQNAMAMKANADGIAKVSGLLVKKVESATKHSTVDFAEYMRSRA